MNTLPYGAWRVFASRNKGREIPKGVDAIFDRAVGFVSGLIPRRKKLLLRAEAILAMEKEYSPLTDAALREKVMELRAIFRRGRQEDPHVDAGFALVREVAFRQRGEKPYLVQVAGGLAIYHGCIAEMATGEGKTLTATMPATLMGWGGKGCHVVTANDYLAKRDCQLMEKVYSFCGLRSGFLEQEMTPADRKGSYDADITYCTNKEIAADFLRDRLAMGKCRTLPEALMSSLGGGKGVFDGLVMRGLDSAIVDEADFVLIDEAVTPLIISGQGANSQQAQTFSQACELASQLRRIEDYKTDIRYHEVELTASGRGKLANLAKPFGDIWTGARRREELVIQALTAREFYIRDKQYVIQDGKVVIVEESTGRLMPDREWRDGLHQAVSAKEGLEIQPPKDTFARISFQRFFRMYRRMGGMTGTASEAKAEFWRMFHLPIVVIPTNKPRIRRQLPDRVFATEKAKWQAVVDEIVVRHATGQPILVGTRSVGASENLSKMLAERGLDHQVLNAVRHAEEANIVAAAGGQGKITVATNMAGRGTDIKLAKGVAELGGLHVIATERHESRRVDRQLFGRAGRQGDPGSAQAFISLDDEIIRRQAPILSSLAVGVAGHEDKEIHANYGRVLMPLAQRHAQRTALRQRLGVLHSDDWLVEHLGFAGTED